MDASVSAPSAAPSPAPAAPSTPAPSAPVSAPAPVAAPSAAPAAPESQPATPAEPGSPAAPLAPAAPYDPKTAPAPPNATDYPNTTDGQAEFATQMTRWHREHPDGVVKPAEAAPDAPKTPEEQALADAAPAEAPKPAAAPEVAATPQAIAEFLKEDAALNAALEGNPKAKGAMFKMARDLAEVAPIRAIFPTEGDAKFADEYSTRMVGLKTAAMRMIESPDNAPAFLEMYDSQFARVNADGTPVLENGKPVYDADRESTIGAIFNREVQNYTQQFMSEMADLKTKLGGNYPNDAARNADQKRLEALEYAQINLDVIKSIRDGSFFEEGPPEPAADATPEQKAWFDQQKAELDRKRQELDDKQKGASKEERTAAAEQFKTAVRNDMGASVGSIIGTTLKAVTDSGVYIPEFYMQEKYVDPTSGKETNTSALLARVFFQFENDLMRPGSRTLMDTVQHELLPQNDQTRQIRKDWYARKAAEMVPTLVQKEVDRIQGLVQLDQKKQAEMLLERNRVAQPEPNTGGSQLPQGASREQILSAAEEMAKKDPGFATASPSEKQARILTAVHRMQKK